MQKRIAVVFDFDDTLGPDSTTAYLDSLGVDTARFWGQEVQALIEDGWDPMPAYLYKMIQYSNAQKSGKRITKDGLIRFGRQHKLYEGATRFFSKIIRRAQAILPDVEVEFFLISGGIGELIRSHGIAKKFRAVWACDFAYNQNEEIVFPKRIVSFTDKTRYLFEISKGIFENEPASNPSEVNKRVAEDQLHVPMNQMIYVGDGFTDVPCFSLIKKSGGVPIGVFDAKAEYKWGKAWEFVEQERVFNLVPADYRQNSALMLTLYMAVDQIATNIKLESQISSR